MAGPQFLTDFQNTMTQLNNMTGQIEGKLQFNTNFNNTLLEKLNNIRTLVEQLSDKIRVLKGSITGIQGRVDDNARDITEKQGECEALREELRARDSALKNMQEANKGLENQIRNGEDAQKRIPELEAQINDLNIRINSCSDAIKYSEKQLTLLNNKNKEKIETIANLTKERDECNRQREELNNRITEGDAAREELALYKSKKASLSKENNDMKAKIANLNAQITSLTKNNEFYKNKIIEATAALNTAIGYLNQFITSPPRGANLGELTRIVNNITELINQISGVLDGNKQNISTLGGTRPVFVAGQNNLIRRKGGKKSIKRNTKKRKYNKYNKQKGGFTYKTTNKRRSITTSIPSSPITSARSLSDFARGRKRRGTSSRTRK